MGWTSFPMHRPVKDWFEQEYISNSNFKTLKTSVVGNVIYSAILKLDTQKIFAAVVLFSYNNRDTYNFSYKDMDESMGPVECSCPKNILKLLTPTDNKFALDWRKRVMDFHNKKAEERNAVKNNKFFKLKVPIEFNNGSSYQYFKKFQGRTFAAYMKENKVMYQVVKIKLLDYEFDIVDQIGN